MSFRDRSIRRVLTWLAGLAALFAAAVAPAANYSRVCEPEIKPAFLPLPPGAVEPAGWLRDWAVAARDGITGHLDEHHATFRDGWKGIPIAAPGAEPNGMGWPLEQCAYWLDGAIRLGFVLHDKALIAKIRARLDPIVDGVNKADFGTSLIYWKKGYKPDGLQRLGPFANGPRAGRALPGQRRAAGVGRPGQGLCRLSCQDGHAPVGPMQRDGAVQP